MNQAAERLFGKPREDLLLHPFGFPLVSGETTELELPTAAGAPRIMEMRVVESDWEEQPACLASLRDITERKDAESAARRLVQERVAREAAEKSARRMRFLANSLTRLTSRLDYPDVLRELADLCVHEIADLAIVYGKDGEGALTRLEVAHRDAAALHILRPLRLDPVGLDSAHPVREVLRSRRSLLFPELTPEQLRTFSRDPGYADLVARLGVRSFAVVPMIARDHVVGALTVASTNPDHLLGDADVALAEDLAHRAALALDNAWLYAKAQEAIRAQTDLIAMVSHDLRTPLTSMLGYAELLTLGIPEPLSDGPRRQVERIQSSGRHLLYLIEQLTAFAKLDAAPPSLDPSEVDPTQLLREVAEVVEPLARDRGLDFRLDVDGSCDRLVTDPGKLRQILLNLAGNAIKFTREGGVTIRARRLDCELAFEVLDTGPGIDPRHLEDVFLPFWQGPPQGGESGAGLGLSIVRRLSTLLGGRVTVESTVGAGSTFTVTLPHGGAAAAP